MELRPKHAKCQLDGLSIVVGQTVHGDVHPNRRFCRDMIRTRRTVQQSLTDYLPNLGFCEQNCLTVELDGLSVNYQ